LYGKKRHKQTEKRVCLKERIYAIEAVYLKAWLDEKNLSITDMAAAKELAVSAGIPIDLFGSQSADDIYRADGDTAHISVSGPLSTEGPDFLDKLFGYGGTSYRAITEAITRAKDDPVIKQAILHVNSPGGTIDGLDDVYMAHAAFAKEKHSEVRVEGMAASAAYWLAAPASKIYATGPTSQIGSIGLIATIIDDTAALESEGYKRIRIVSGNAPDKRPDPLTEEGRSVLRDQINALEDVFFQRVSEGRHVTADYARENYGRGRLLIAGEAERVGMIDGLTETARAHEESAEPKAQHALLQGAKIPATAGSMEDSVMTLSEFLAQNPAAAAEIERLKAESLSAGRETARAEFSAQVDKVMGVITSEAYPVNIKTIAAECLAGKQDMAAFSAAVAVYDATTEKAKSDEAKAHTADLGATGAAAPDTKPAAEKELDAAIKAELDKRRANTHA
jgi:ClpP class serine protease